MSITSAFTEAILPVLSIAGAGYVLANFRDVNAQPLSTVTIYVLVPALVFHSLVTADVGGDTGLKVVVASVVMTFVMWGVSEGVARFVTDDYDTRNGLVLSGVFPNTANYGIPLSAFAFPAVGKPTAIIYVIASTVMIYTVGVYVASRDENGSASAVRRVLALPLVYAMVVAGVVNLAGVSIPSSTMETVGLVGDSSIPVMLLVLGIQLGSATPSGSVSKVGAANLLRLVVAPVVAVPVVVLLGFSNPDVARVVVLESSMPVAVTTLILTMEFKGDVDYVSTAVLTTTLVSIVVLTLLIALLQSGVVV